MDPKQLTVTVNDVTLTEAQVDAMTDALARKRKEVAERARAAQLHPIRVGGRSGGRDYINIPRAVVREMAAVLERNDRGDYACLYTNGAVGFNCVADVEGTPRLTRWVE